MQKKPYSLWKRRLNSGRFVYYVRFRLENGAWSTAKSSGQTKKTMAEAWAIEYLKSGQIVLKENIRFSDFADGFFDYDGPFIKSQLYRGKTIGRRHAENQNAEVKNHLTPVLGDIKLSKIDSEVIEELVIGMSAAGKASGTINHVLITLRTILQYAYKKKYIQHMPIIEMIPRKQKDRGILTVEEVKAFFAQEWADKRYYAFNLIAATTGMRMGEIRALQRKAVFDDYIEVSVSWEKGHGLKCTKTGRSRYVPLPERAKTALDEVMLMTPFKEPDDFIFVGRRREAPLDTHIIQLNFYKALKGIGIDNEARKARNITFHSWRHFFNSLLVNSRVPIPKVQTITGHSTDRMTENYFHADEYSDVLKITGEI